MHLGIAGGLDAARDAALIRCFDVGVATVAEWCGPLAPQARTIRREVTSGNLLCLRVRPVQSVTSVAGAAGPVVVDLDRSDLGAGVVALRGNRGVGPGEGRGATFYTVNAVVGWNPTPEPLNTAALIIGGWTWSTIYRGGNYDAGGDTVQLGGFAVPRQADQLMNPYKMW